MVQPVPAANSPSSPPAGASPGRARATQNEEKWQRAEKEKVLPEAWEEEKPEKGQEIARLGGDQQTPHSHQAPPVLKAAQIPVDFARL